MTDSLSPTQHLVLFKLVFTYDPNSPPPLQSELRPKLTTKQRDELAKLGLIRLEPRTGKLRGKVIVLTDKAWGWASENLESKWKVTQSAVPVLQAVLHRLSGFLRARSLNLAEFDTVARGQTTSPTPQPPVTEASTAQPQTPQGSVQERIRNAYLALSGGRFGQMIRLADLKQALGDLPSPAIDEALLWMQKTGDVSLQTIESIRDTTEADRRAAIKILGQDRNLVYMEK